ncbi:hypothetical protein [Flavobacterium seoulense]|uniref:Uncharacterized protein n=1 Tax=Flavobacterium seoulense TaxID=1492738 RepID=A0A066WKE9_9FLAO|nr:hypothetical protein [Flavobacterium seoulense]KDN54477.1 hypothetical protein FEM21_24390 [Flavobacterium seoulense]
MSKILISFFIFFSVIAFGQSTNSLELKGKVASYISNLEGIYVINLQSEQSVSTNENGDFVIKANAGDTLLFSGVLFKQKKILLCEEDFTNENFKVHLVATVTQLNEVVVRNYSNINAVSVGIISANKKAYTPAERKYATASSARLNPMGLDPVLNLISGRSAVLKKEIAIEKKEGYMILLEKMFGKEHFITKLQLPLDYIKGFEYYVVDNQKFTKILEMKNKTTIEFLLAELAQKYKAIIARENQ